MSPYLDHRLTGQQMLAMQRHLQDCPDCFEEYNSVRQTKFLLRSLTHKNPRTALETRLLDSLDSPADRAAPSWWPAPMSTWGQGRRCLAAACALSCLAILWMAPPFAPATVDLATVPSPVRHHFSGPPAGFAAPYGGSGLFSLPGAGMVSSNPFAAWLRSSRVSRDTQGEAQPVVADDSAGPLDDEVANGYVRGEATMAAYAVR